MSKICIVLATYNGEKYLPAMLDSLIAQTRQADMIIAVDDGSKDNTVKVLEKYKDRLPLQIYTSECNQGHKAAFSRALTIAKEKLSDDDYIALADQDDVWLKTKLNDLDSAIGNSDCDLVFGDAQIVDGNGKIIAESWRSLAKIPTSLSLQALTTGFTNVTGCLSIFKASLLNIALPIPANVHVHDQWLALCAASRNGYKAIDQKLIQYRIHGNNAIGLGDKYSWSEKHKLNLNWAKTVATTELYQTFSDKDKVFVQKYIRFMEARSKSYILPFYLPWVAKNTRALFPHVHSFIKVLPRIFFSAIGIPFATRFLNKK